MKYFTCITSPLGMVTIQCRNGGISGIWFETQTTQPDDLGTRDDRQPVLVECVRQLTAYFRRERTAFDLPLSLQGTPFQVAVWQALQNIPYGETRTYKQLAQDIGNPRAVRAVGAANGRNPVSVVVPCHRVVGVNGALTGYAGGTQRKAWLLNLECVCD